MNIVKAIKTVISKLIKNLKQLEEAATAGYAASLCCCRCPVKEHKVKIESEEHRENKENK